MIYYFIWGIVAVFMLIGYYKESFRPFMAFLIIFFVVLFAGLRYERWSDWEGYYDLFMHAGQMDRDIEYGYKFLCEIGNFLLRDYNIFLCAIYSVVFYLHYREYKDTVPSMVTFCLFVFISVSLLTSGGMREFIAIGITLFSVKYIRTKKLSHFVILVVIAALIHRTAVFFLPAYFVDKLKLEKKRVIIYAVLCVALARMGAFQALLSFIAPLFNRFPSFAYRIRLYAYNITNFNIFSLSFLKRTLLLVLALLVGEENISNSQEKQNRRIYVNLYTIGYFISILVPGQFARLSGYFSVAEPLIECFVLKQIVNTRTKSLLFFTFIIMYFVDWTNTLRTFYPELLLPYRCVLFY